MKKILLIFVFFTSILYSAQENTLISDLSDKKDQLLEKLDIKQFYDLKTVKYCKNKSIIIGLVENYSINPDNESLLTLDINRRPQTPLAQAIKENDLSFAEFLLKKQADPNQVELVGSPSLPILYKVKTKEMAELLFRYGAELIENEYISILTMEGVRNNSELATYLIRKGANVNKQDSNGDTPLIREIREFLAKNQHNIQILLNAGASINFEDNQEYNALKYLKKLLDKAVEENNFIKIEKLEKIRTYMKIAYEREHYKIKKELEKYLIPDIANLAIYTYEDFEKKPNFKIYFEIYLNFKNFKKIKEQIKDINKYISEWESISYGPDRALYAFSMWDNDDLQNKVKTLATYLNIPYARTEDVKSILIKRVTSEVEKFENDFLKLFVEIYYENKLILFRRYLHVAQKLINNQKLIKHLKITINDSDPEGAIEEIELKYKRNKDYKKINSLIQKAKALVGNLYRDRYVLNDKVFMNILSFVLED